MRGRTRPVRSGEVGGEDLTMVSQRERANRHLVQDAIELRHDVEALAQRCQRLYVEANELVVRLRELSEQMPAPPADEPPRSDPAPHWSSACPGARPDARA